MISTWVGLRYYMARDYAQAIEQNRNSVELDPNFAAAHLLLGGDYVVWNLDSKSETRAVGSPDASGKMVVNLAFSADGKILVAIDRGIDRGKKLTDGTAVV